MFICEHFANELLNKKKISNYITQKKSRNYFHQGRLLQLIPSTTTTTAYYNDYYHHYHHYYHHLSTTSHATPHRGTNKERMTEGRRTWPERSTTTTTTVCHHHHVTTPHRRSLTLPLNTFRQCTLKSKWRSTSSFPTCTTNCHDDESTSSGRS